jgi:hypothetical protein
MDQVSNWDTSSLDRVRFPPMVNECSFDFLDPVLVLRGSHIIPAFTSLRKYQNGLGVSACAGDKDDWQEHYVNR